MAVIRVGRLCLCASVESLVRDTYLSLQGLGMARPSRSVANLGAWSSRVPSTCTIPAVHPIEEINAAGKVHERFGLLNASRARRGPEVMELVPEERWLSTLDPTLTIGYEALPLVNLLAKGTPPACFPVCLGSTTSRTTVLLFRTQHLCCSDPEDRSDRFPFRPLAEGLWTGSRYIRALGDHGGLH